MSQIPSSFFPLPKLSSSSVAFEIPELISVRAPKKNSGFILTTAIQSFPILSIVILWE